MTTRIDDSGPAYPVPGLQHGESFNGMSLRDYFAAKAMQGLISSNDSGAGDRIDEIPAYAYLIADAMLAARSEGEPDAT